MFGTMPWSLRSRPELNARPDPGEDHDPRVVLVGDGVEGVVELDHELDRHRVEPIGAVHPHDRDVRARVLHEHEGRGIRHGPGP